MISAIHPAASSLPLELLLAVVVVIAVIGLVGVLALALVALRPTASHGATDAKDVDTATGVGRNRVHLAAGARRPPSQWTARHGTLRGLMDLHSPDPDARRRMCELLVVCFTADEFRRFIADVDPALPRELLGEPCTAGSLIAHGVDLLLRHGHVDLHFFNIWAELRPKRRSQILLVAGEMGCVSPQPAVAGAAMLTASAAASPLRMAVPPAGQDFNVWLFLAFVLVIVVVVALFIALRNSPYRVEYTIAAFLIGAAFVLALLRHDIAALVALVAGLFVLVWTAMRADRQAAIART